MPAKLRPWPGALCIVVTSNATRLDRQMDGKTVRVISTGRNSYGDLCWTYEGPRVILRNSAGAVVADCVPEEWLYPIEPKPTSIESTRNESAPA